MYGSLAQRLRVLRAERGWTLNQAAERAGVQPETISDAEHGKRRPYTPTLAKIAAAYGVPVEELLEEPVPERHADWGAAVDKARRLREDVRAPIEKLLAAWRESEERGDKEEQLAHLREVARLMDEVYNAETELGFAYVKAMMEEGSPEGLWARRLRSANRKMVLFYEELIGLIKDAGVPVKRRDEGEAVEETEAPARPEALELTVY
jgi:transcriptional regulator with XRE-family HTH domain